MNLKKSIITLLILVLSTFMLGNIKCYAASGSFSLSKSSVSLKKGKSTTVTLTIKNCTGRFTVTSSDTSVSTVSISDDGWTDGGNLTITIKAKKKGTANISVIAYDVSDTTPGNEQEITGTKTIKVTVTEENSSSSSNNNSSGSSSSTSTSSNSSTMTTETKVSTDATLKNLGITPSQYDFTGFRKMTTSYSVTVPYEAEKINIYASTNDSKATVTGTGSKTLKLGENIFSIKATAEDKKTTKTYTLKITREKEKTEQENENNDDKKEENNIVGLTNLQVEGLELTPSFSNDIYEYNVKVPSDTKALNIKTEKSSDDIKIDIAGNENLKLGENIITLLVYNSKTDKTTTYQIIANIEEDKIDLTEVNNSMSIVQRKILTKKIIVIVTLIIIIILIVAFIIERNKIMNKNEFVENNNKEAKIDLSKDESMFERINENTEVAKKRAKKVKGKRFK